LVYIKDNKKINKLKEIGIN